MNINEVIKYPILTEKTYDLMSKDIYMFAVDLKTNRTEVKKAIEFIFQVKVVKVNIINIEKKPAKLGKSKGFTNKIKKAIIILKEGKINIYPDETKETNKSQSLDKNLSSDKNKQTIINNKILDVEKKAAAKIALGLKKQEDKKVQENKQNKEKVEKK